MMEGFNRVLSDSPENRNIERLSVKDVKPETGMSVNEAMEYVRKAYFPDSGENLRVRLVILDKVLLMKKNKNKGRNRLV